MAGKFKKSQIPNSYYALMALAFVAVAAVVFVVNIGMTNKQLKQDAGTAQTSSPPAIRYAKDHLRLGMTRGEVIRAMGMPNWVLLPTDSGVLAPPKEGPIGLELRWQNPSCRDAVVMFSPPPYKVVGWDAGMDFCKSRLSADRSAYVCSLPERKQYCAP